MLIYKYLTLYSRATFSICELFALYFRNEQSGEDNCPFLSDEVNIHKIKQAKDLLIRDVANPPLLKTLTAEVGLSDHQLKEGLKKFSALRFTVICLIIS